MKKTPIHKNGDIPFAKQKIRPARDLFLVATPAVDFVFP
jgi:hypothetical protein